MCTALGGLHSVGSSHRTHIRGTPFSLSHIATAGLSVSMYVSPRSACLDHPRCFGALGRIGWDCRITYFRHTNIPSSPLPIPCFFLLPLLLPSHSQSLCPPDYLVPSQPPTQSPTAPLSPHTPLRTCSRSQSLIYLRAKPRSIIILARR